MVVRSRNGSGCVPDVVSMVSASMIRVIQKLGLFVGVFFVVVAASHACPSCKDAYEIGSKQSSIGESYSYSVVFFLSMFTSLIVGGTLFLRRQMMIAQRTRQQAATDIL